MFWVCVWPLRVLLQPDSWTIYNLLQCKCFAWSKRTSTFELSLSKYPREKSCTVFHWPPTGILFCFVFYHSKVFLFLFSRVFYMDNTIKFEPWTLTSCGGEHGAVSYCGVIHLSWSLHFLWVTSVDHDFKKANDTLLFWQREDKQLQRRGWQLFQWPQYLPLKR